MKCQINFMIIGAQKCATTTLYDWLKQHPDIFLPTSKDLPFFHDGLLQNKPKNFIELCYAKYSDEKIIGGAWVNLMYYHFLAKKMYEYNRKMKCIAVLRNPVDRAYSNYWYARGLEMESYDTFEKALQAEPKRMHGTIAEQTTLTYLAHGHYEEQLQPYIKHFGADNIFVCTVNELKRDKDNYLKDILLFLLGSSGGIDKINTSRNSNTAQQPIIPYAMSWLRSPNGWHKKIGRKIVSAKGQAYIRDHVINKLININKRSFTYPTMTVQTRHNLVDYYIEHNEKLSKLLGRDFSYWNQ